MSDPVDVERPERNPEEPPPPGGGESPGDNLDTEVPLAPPPPPAIDPFASPVLGGPGDLSDVEKRLWLFLQHEAYRHRGEGLRTDWAFHLYASQKNLGAPLAPNASAEQQISAAGRRYGYQVFAGDTVLNEVPKWREVQSLNTLLDGKIPPDGLARQILEASYIAGGTALHDSWAFHQMAVRERLGPPLTESYRVTLEGQEYSIQIFAGDTLYSPVPHWSDVRRLSDTPPGSLYELLWNETCRVGGFAYDPQSPFQQLAAREKLGTPVTGVYQADFEGILYSLQVFAGDTLYARPDAAPARQSRLVRPDQFMIEFPEVPPVPEEATSDTPAAALENRRFSFHLLPIAGRPRISQFFGYTKWAAGNGAGLYGATQGRHPGVDFAVPVGTPLLSIGHGLVVWSGANVRGKSFGAGPRSIIVRYGDIYAVYGHVESESVRKGQHVVPGQEIGRSGWPAGPHLHFEIRPVPEPTLHSRDPNQDPQNPGFPLNPLEIFASEWKAYFEQWYARLGGPSHFCVGSLYDQPGIRFGGAVDRRSCTN